MGSNQFSELVQKGLEDGQEHLATTMRQLVFKEAPDLFELMDFENDRLFLNPALFAWFTDKSRSIPLEQILYGLIAEQERPSLIEIKTDRLGRAYLPGLGHIETELADTDLWLQYDKNTDYFKAKVTSEWFRVVLKKDYKLPNHQIVVFDQIPAVHERFVSINSKDKNIRDSLKATLPNNIEYALDLIRRIDSEIYSWLAKATQSISLYSAIIPKSFATLSAHGMAFCNCNDESDYIFFIDDLVHQCSNMVFNAMTLKKDEFLAVDPETPLKTITNKPNETRQLYTVFRELFAYSLVTRTLHGILESGCLGPLHRLQAMGRLAFCMEKFYSDLEDLKQRYLYTEKGLDLYNNFSHAYESKRRDYGKKTKLFDMGNQRRVFSRSTFLASNPLQTKAARTRELMA